MTTKKKAMLAAALLVTTTALVLVATASPASAAAYCATKTYTNEQDRSCTATVLEGGALVCTNYEDDKGTNSDGSSWETSSGSCLTG
jgi:hypothetical protein